MISRTFIVSSTLAFLMTVSGLLNAAPLGNEFTYQGMLTDAGTPVAGTRDFRFTLFDAVTAGHPVAGPVEVGDVTVDEGRFSVMIDLGDVFDGSAAWLEIEVRPGDSDGAYTLLAPRQPLTGTPLSQYAGRSGLANRANNALELAGEAPSYYLDWTNLAHKPQGLDDGDDDALGNLACDANDIAKWNGSVWNCAVDDDTPFASTYVIGPVGTEEENGLALLAAYGAIPPPTDETNQVFVKLEPGRYRLPDGVPLILMPWTTVEGSGNTYYEYPTRPTTIVATNCSTIQSQSAVVHGNEFAMLSNLAVINDCSDPASYSTAVYNEEYGFSLIGVAAVVSEGAARNVAIFNSGQLALIKNTHVQAKGGTQLNRGIENNEPNVRVLDSYVYVSSSPSSAPAIGIHNDWEFLKVDGVYVLAGSSSSAIGIGGRGTNVEILNSEVAGSTKGISLDYPFGLKIENVEARSIGVALEIIAPADSGFWSGVLLRNVQLSGEDRGLDVQQYAGTLVVEIEGSLFYGANSSIRALDASVFIADTRLMGGPIVLEGSGTATCAGVWDSAFTFYADTCP